VYFVWSVVVEFDKYDHKIPATFNHRVLVNGSLTSLVNKQCKKKKKLVSWVESRINVAGKSLVVHAYSACFYHLGIKLQFREIFCLVCFPSKKGSAKNAAVGNAAYFCRVAWANISCYCFYVFKPVFLGAFNATMYHVFICTCYRAFCCTSFSDILM